VRPFDDTAKIFSVFLSVVGVSAGLFTLGAVFEEQLEDTLDRYGRRRMDRRIAKLSQHVVVCGYGRVGMHIVGLLSGRDIEIVVVDIDDRLVAEAASTGVAVVEGSATEDDVLKAAGIERAATLIVSVGDDAVGISTVLSARALNPDLKIIARANQTSSEAKLKRAGCDRVVNPLHQGAQRMAAFAQQPDVADFLDVVVHDEDVEYRLEELRVTDASWFAGRTLGDAHVRRETGALVLAVRRGDGSFVSNPRPDVLLEPGTTLIAIGTGEQLKALGRLLKVETPEV
jgi:voltage-gated potassium channel